MILLVSWVLFRSPTLYESLTYLERMFAPILGQKAVSGPLAAEMITHRQWTALAIAAFCSFVPWDSSRVIVRESSSFAIFRTAACGAGAIALFYLSTLSAVNSQFHPFIYFRF